jgi:hypothetical protein
MATIYDQVIDQTVLRDYKAVLAPGATIAGTVCHGDSFGRPLGRNTGLVESNFFKTELELGHCLRLPQEGPSECDLYLRCAKFVTTKEYAPRLRTDANANWG